jgi:hypothetical protein
MSVWIISKIYVLRLTSFLIFLTYFPLIQSAHYSKSKNSKCGRIDSLTDRSILPLEIWPKRQCHNFEEIVSILFRFLVTFIDGDLLIFSSHTLFVFSARDNK